MQIWKRLVVALGLAVLAVPAAVTAADAPSPAHLAQAERLVYALGIVESFRIPAEQSLKQIETLYPEQAAAMDRVVRPLISKQRIGGEFREFMAGRLDLETCRQLADLWEGPVGRKYVAVQVALLSGGEPPSLQLTETEQAILQDFQRSEAYTAFLQLGPALQAKITDYRKDTEAAISRGLRGELARQRQAPAAN